jgi:hypothetical protein
MDSQPFKCSLLTIPRVQTDKSHIPHFIALPVYCYAITAWQSSYLISACAKISRLDSS